MSRRDHLVEHAKLFALTGEWTPEQASEYMRAAVSRYDLDRDGIARLLTAMFARVGELAREQGRVEERAEQYEKNPALRALREARQHLDALDAALGPFTGRKS
jgi:hypothetical protein